MAFTPKFVDLVRNFTTVQGTGPVTLGSAVNGYTSFAEALSIGEQFYYCIQGVEKPQEREVGRGTMQADGKIARQPVAGSPTSFSSGTKTIALVAAAEWFARLDGAGAGGGSIEAASRSALAAASPSRGPAMLTEAGREGLFVFDGSNFSAKVGSDPRQAIYIAPASDPTGTSGCWVRKHEGDIRPEWFGAVGDDVTDDGPAFAAAIAWLRANSASYGDAYYKGSARLRVGAKKYFLGVTTLDINHTLVIEGEGSGVIGGIPTRLRWSGNATGIRVHAYNTVAQTGADGGSQKAADGIILRGLFLMGDYTDFASEGEHHGIQLRGKAVIEDCYVYNFQGDGVHINASAGSGPGNEGNANLFQLNRVTATGNRHGFYVNEIGRAHV